MKGWLKGELLMKDAIEKVIIKAVADFDGNYECSPFEKLISMGELVDRLAIVNFKLFTLKDTVMNRQDDEEFCAWASVEDVKLVEERARLKRCIDEKLASIINRVVNGDNTGGFNPEVKKYGDNNV